MQPEDSFLLHGSKEQFRIYGTSVYDRTDGKDDIINIFYKLGV